MSTTTLAAGRRHVVNLLANKLLTLTGTGDVTITDGTRSSVQRLTATRQYGPYLQPVSIEVDATTDTTALLEDVPSTRSRKVSASRDLTAADNDCVLEATATITLTVPDGLPEGFSCAVIPNGTTSVARGGSVLLNGGSSTLTRADTLNPMFAIQQRASSPNSYVVTGS